MSIPSEKASDFTTKTEIKDTDMVPILINNGDGTWTNGIVSRAVLLERPVSFGLVNGSIALDSGVSDGSVTGLGLKTNPITVILTVRCQVNALVLYAATISGSISADGFQFVLSGQTDSSGYILDFIVT
jgi:hypothetical protein